MALHLTAKDRCRHRGTTPDGKWLKLASVTPLATGLAPAIGWVYKDEMKILGGNRYLITDKATDAPTTPQQGLNIHAAANQNSDTLAVLPHATQIKISSEGAVGKYRKLVTIVSGESVPALTAGESGSLPGFVWLDSLEAKSQPKAKDSVVVLETPVTIKAGALIGHLGSYQNYDDAAAKPLLHLEVFSCEDVPTFIAKSRARARSLPATQKTLLKIHKSASKLIPHREGIGATNPPKISDEGVKVGVDLIIPVSVLENLPADRKIKASEAIPGNTTPQITQWWRLDNLLADEAGNPINGWLAEQELITTRHSPWEWEGFDFISETVCAADQLACHLDAQRLLSEVGLTDYQAQISTADHGPVKTRLYDIIDGADGTARDDKLTTTEIRAALGKPWHAQSISHLITHYESEWFWKPSKWDELDKLMEDTSADPNTDWLEEKKRIEKLSWWKELAGQPGIATDGVTWHFHLNGVLSQFIAPIKALITFDQMKRMFPESSEIKREEVRELFNRYATRFEINTAERISQFFAQIKAEVGSALVGNEESLWYSIEALKSKFKRYFNQYPADADELGYKRISLPQFRNLNEASRQNYTVKGQYAYSQLPQPDEIAKRVYCCNSSSGGFVLTQGGCDEGLTYKGRGFIQLTWKTNYEQVEKILKEKIPEENINIVSNSDQLLETKYGLLSAMGFWEWKKLNTKVQGSTDSTDAITAVINLSTDSYQKRRDNFTETYQVLK